MRKGLLIGDLARNAGLMCPACWPTSRWTSVPPPRRDAPSDELLEEAQLAGVERAGSMTKDEPATALSARMTS
jgi:hypothetical protein